MSSADKVRSWKAISSSPFFIRLFNWEFWPFYVAYIPVYFYWIYLSFKARSPFFISASNPVIPTGGLYGESKMTTLNLVPPEFKPKTMYVSNKTSVNEVLNEIKQNGISFPLIAKPEVGERGFLVEIMHNNEELKDYLCQKKINTILQEFIEYPHEFNVLYYRFPDEVKGKITSITIKEFLSVEGDGQSTVEQLMLKDPRAALQLKRFRKNYNGLLKTIPLKNEQVKLEPIGNHARGTTFLNGNHMINERVTNVFDNIARKMYGCYILRFDVKCKRPECLETGEGLKIVEVNGAGGEPTHIYDPAYPLLDSYRDLLNHWNIIYHVSQVNRERGIQYMTFRQAKKMYSVYRKYVKEASRT